MATPTFSKLNGQIKTAWRWYDGFHKLAEFQQGCEQGTDDCPAPCILSAPDHLPPFQFARPTSVDGITSWKLYNNAGTEVVDLAANLGAISIERFTTWDIVIYGGSILAAQLDPGLYYSRVVTGGNVYYSEPVRVVCSPEGDNCFPTDWRQDQYQNALNPSNYWIPGDNTFANFFDHLLAVAGPPSNPAWEVEGTKVANSDDELLYTYTGGSWVSSTPATGWWFNNDGGFWWQYTGGAWVGGAGQPHQVFANYGIQFYPGDGLPISMNVGSLPCSCNDTGPIRIEVTVDGATAGTVTVGIDGDDPFVISADGVHSFTSYIANGYMLVFTPSDDFDGGISEIRFFCLLDSSECYRRLTWTNCGNVGNTYFEDGFTDEFWLDTQANPILPTPANRVESEEQADGTLIETFRRKEVRYTMRLGLLPWPAADALTDMALMDTIRLYHTSGDGYDTLADVKVEVTYDESVSECLPEVEVSFRIDNTAVACCDDFTRPCLVPCVDAEGFASDAGPGADGDWLDDDVSRYIEYLDGVDAARIACESGAANIKIDAIEAIPKTNNLQTYLFDPGLMAWVSIGVIDTVSPTLVGSDCEVIIQATLQDGYSGRLQFWDGFTWTDADFDVLTAEEWLNNTTVWVKEAGAQYIRLQVIVGTCEVGFTAAWTSLVTCS
jgi:hypothetical protein